MLVIDVNESTRNVWCEEKAMPANLHERRERVVKQRRRLTAAERFERAIAQMPGEDPVFPVLMHSFERLLAGETDLSDFDRVIQAGIDRHPELSRRQVADWIEKWHEMPEDIKRRFVPPEFSELTLSDKVSLQAFQAVAARSVMRMPSLKVTTLWTARIPFTWGPGGPAGGPADRPPGGGTFLEPPAHVDGTIPHGIDANDNVAVLGQ
ncbi:MAG: hypothetical protein ACXVAT_19800, partial [Isosphaeraceae bacterium]